MKGADGQMWQVKKLSSGSCQRWIKVRVVLSKSKANKSKRTIRSTTCESNDKTKKSIPNCALDGSNKLKRSLSEKCLVKTLMRTSAYNRSSCNGCSKSGCYYTGKEASPKGLYDSVSFYSPLFSLNYGVTGLGQCAHLLPVGEKRIGRDGYEWEVIKCGTGKRWKQLPDYSSDSESSDYD